MLTQEQIQNLKKKWQIDEFTILREYIQILFLSYFYQAKESQKVFFKGGTALRLIFNSFRFSEDLDFTALEDEEILNQLVASTVKKLSQEVPEISLKPLEHKGQGLTARLDYHLSDLPMPLTVKLDFSQREEVLDTQTSVIKTLFPVLIYPVVNHYSLTEIMAEKIRAIMTRVQGRDLFDLWFLLSKEVQIDWGMVDKKMQYYNQQTSQEEVIEKISNWDSNELKQDLNKFLPQPQRIVIAQLKEDLLAELK